MHVPPVLWMALLQLVAAELPPPSLTPSSVVPASPNDTRAMQAGMLVTIYGRNLGPDLGCSPDPSVTAEAQELCGTVVTVDGDRAGLLYVQERQINLRLPAGASSEQTLQFVVRYQGRSSPAVPVLPQRSVEPVKRGVERAHISLLGRAHVHMPIWIAVNLPATHQSMVRYPITVDPADLGGHDFEVRRENASLPKLTTTDTVPKGGSGPVSLGTIGGGTLLGLPYEPRTIGRLPLHLLFRFTDPGQYQVRYTGYDFGGVALVRSDWLSLQVEPYPEAHRLAWLQELQRTAPTDSVDLLTEYLPALLAQPDRRTLAMLEPQLYHANEMVRNYVLYALYFFEDKEIVRWMPDVLKRRGPTPELAYFLSWRRNLFEPQSDKLFGYVSGHLRSKSTLVLAGVLQSMAFLKLTDTVRNSRTTVAKMDAHVAELSQSIAKQTSPEVLERLALYLGHVKTERSRRVLWRMVEQGKVPQQALICLTWIGDPRDLPRLASYLDRYDLEDNLNRAYGEAASSYVKRKP
ncbi:MAG: hypothetical protein H7039_13255 [Bryobacteraceae bacterium]|nr:hypothetical protein [Bryobacteraceae bacterium]